ncbi:DUF5313 family protein [Umezawaea beigongshangensis]|uniref:DUF5313 family protein n=1 Tax=Umezawaea beigongshangensis TaxID=2780383 RepID=UPI0027DCC7FE|nr:DUF5313 family protein [Umezawaea beigongshangensis]
MSELRRPGPVRWVWYAFGGRLPVRHRDWVHHDLTTRTWFARFLLRSLVQVTPLVVVIALGLALGLGAPWPLALASSALGFVVGVYYSLSYAVESTENRISRYGYPRGEAERTRRARRAEAAGDAAARYDAVHRRTP